MTHDNDKAYTVTETDEEKDLGVYITKDLKWSTQCSKAASKAMQTLGLIKRNFSQLDKHSFVVMYNTYVRPVLELRGGLRGPGPLSSTTGPLRCYDKMGLEGAWFGPPKFSPLSNSVCNESLYSICVKSDSLINSI